MNQLPNKEKELIENEIQNLNQVEKQNLLDWAIQVKDIQDNKSLTKKQKIYNLRKLNNKRAFFNSIQLIQSYFSTKWKKANLPTKFTLIGGGAGLLIAGSQGAGIAALGGAIGIPFFLITAGGGALIGTLIDNLKNKNK